MPRRLVDAGHGALVGAARVRVGPLATPRLASRAPQPSSHPGGSAPASPHRYVPLPKSVKPKRVAQNIDILGFVLSKTEMAKLDALDEQFFTEWKEWGNLDPTALR